MGKTTSGPHPPPPHDDPVAHLLGRVAWLMDRSFTIPGTNVRAGLDSLLGIVPVGGDVLTGLVQAGLVLVALGRYRVPPAVAARMLANVLLDVGVGSIPLVGDIFDVGFKANTRNMTLLDPYISRPGPGPSPSRALAGAHPVAVGWGCVVGLAVVVLGALLLVLVGFITVIRWIARA